MRSSRLYLLLGVIVAAVVVGGYFAAGRMKSSKVEVAAEAARPVAVIKVERHNLARRVDVVAELTPYVVDDVYAKVSGYLKSISVDYGDHVNEGQTLAVLELPEQEADLAKLQAAYVIAKLDYDRVVAVTRKTPGLLAQEEVDKAEAAYKMAAANLEYAKVIMSYTVVTAPFRGIVIKRYVNPGALIQVGTSSATQAIPLVRVSDNYRLRLVVEVPESVAARVDVGTPVTVTIQSTGEHIQSKVARISNAVSTNTRTMHTEVDIFNDDLHLKPGMYASADIVVQAKPNVVALPLEAVSNEGGPHVWVVTPQHRVTKRKVELGLRTSNYVEIVSGVQAGDMVVVGHLAELGEGSKVTPKVVQKLPSLDD